MINRNRILRKKIRVSRNIKGLSSRPRITVYRSNKYIYAQAIDDEKRLTLASYASLNLKKTQKEQKLKKSEQARMVGMELAGLLKKKKIDTAVFDRNRYIYAGRVKNLCEGLREGGIKI